MSREITEWRRGTTKLSPSVYKEVGDMGLVLLRHPVRVVIVEYAGTNGWHVPSQNPGCHTYQSRDLDDVVDYVAAHGTTYASLAGARRAIRRMVES